MILRLQKLDKAKNSIIKNFPELSDFALKF